MSGISKDPSGYVNSTHVFGRSKMIRQGQKYYIQWQWHESDSPFKVILLTKPQYMHIKALLGAVVREEKVRINDYAYTLRAYHKQTSLCYIRIKRYLKKEGLLV